MVFRFLLPPGQTGYHQSTHSYPEITCSIAHSLLRPPHFHSRIPGAVGVVLAGAAIAFLVMGTRQTFGIFLRAVPRNWDRGGSPTAWRSPSSA